MAIKLWGYLDSAPEQHINEPVVASCIIGSRGSVKRQVVAAVVDEAIKEGVKAEQVGGEEAKKKLEKEADVVVGGLLARKDIGVRLPPQMYLVVGLSKFGLYHVVQGNLLLSIKKELLAVPIEKVAEFTIGQTHVLVVDLTIRLADGLILELEFGRTERKFIEEIETRLRQVNPALISLPPPPPAQKVHPGQKSKEQWIKEGEAQVRAKHFQDALAAYDAALQLDPTFGYAYFGKGEALRLLNRREDALLAFERAIQLSPHDAAPYRRKGYVLNALKRYSEALAVLEQAISLEPGYAGSYVGKGDALSGLERPEEALAAYNLALKLEPGNSAAAAGKSQAQRLMARPAASASDAPAPPPKPKTQPGRRVAELPGKARQPTEATEVIVRPAPVGPKGVLTLPSGRRVALIGAEALVGRGNSLVGPEAIDVDLTSESEQKTVSRQHARITRAGNGFEIEDLDSANQTLLNHEQLQPRRRYRLRNGDVVEFGKVKCAFTIE